jgi:hypothetical protein
MVAFGSGVAEAAKRLFERGSTGRRSVPALRATLALK